MGAMEKMEAKAIQVQMVRMAATDPEQDRIGVRVLLRQRSGRKRE
jgi:hypothetical protein